MAKPNKQLPKTEINPGVLVPGNYAGVDQGVDFRGKGKIPALGSGVVTDVGTSSIIEGGQYPYVIYKLTSGPNAGKFIYVAENFAPSVRVGQKLTLGQSIGKALGTYPYIELGWNQSEKGWNPAAPLGANPHAATGPGSDMLDFLRTLTGTEIGGQNPPTGSSGGANPLAAGVGCIVPAMVIGSFLGLGSWIVLTFIV